MKLQSLISGALLVAAAIAIPGQANAQAPYPGYIYDLATVHPAAFNAGTYSQFTTSFVASAASEYVSFSFRESPAYVSFADISITPGSSTTTLLAEPGGESDSASNIDTNFPVGWFRWIQPIDTSAIGVVAGTTFAYGCDSGTHAGNYFWCDGSVQGYDGLYQLLSGLTVGATYNISFWLTDDSGAALTAGTSTSCTSSGGSCIDMVVYAGTALPSGAVPVGSTPTTPTTPAPPAIWLTLLGIGGVGLYMAYRAGTSRV
jgi:prepilin-type processing-associated H-X9-DG protein